MKHDTIYRLVTNTDKDLILLVTVSYKPRMVTLTMIEEGIKSTVYQLEHPDLVDMCLDCNWVKPPVPDMVLDENKRLFISWSETFCVDLNILDTYGTD